MSKPFEVEERGLQKEVLVKFLETANVAQVSRELGINYFNLVHYITWVKENKPEWLEKYSDDMKIDVFRVIRKYVNKLEKKLDEWELANKEKLWLAGIDRLNKQLGTHIMALERVYNIGKREEEIRVIMDAIKEESPETAVKIVQKLKQLRDGRHLLS